MSQFVAMIRDDLGNGVRVDRIDGWEKRGNYADPRTRIYLAGGGLVDLRIKVDEFTERLDRALTALRPDEETP